MEIQLSPIIRDSTKMYKIYLRIEIYFWIFKASQKRWTIEIQCVLIAGMKVMWLQIQRRNNLGPGPASVTCLSRLLMSLSFSCSSQGVAEGTPWFSTFPILGRGGEDQMKTLLWESFRNRQVFLQPQLLLLLLSPPLCVSREGPGRKKGSGGGEEGVEWHFSRGGYFGGGPQAPPADGAGVRRYACDFYLPSVDLLWDFSGHLFPILWGLISGA